eukprot:Blabericola_migrator_1__10952@NODE_633_length_7142_cov_112_965230_g464_i0_p5_GENE_NODE_633_length_7142_cov_112_965230_g464_i0NODE_633_length_7142_cov_112_965230_g464_i0_p5_ORF_typecomplete_len168_score6_24Pax2_C/PF12403_8/0_45Pax2_C/PF12403_8/2e02_NODE_633_length_7142_cov_112_965230_g464_i027463249
MTLVSGEQPPGARAHQHSTQPNLAAALPPPLPPHHHHSLLVFERSSDLLEKQYAHTRVPSPISHVDCVSAGSYPSSMIQTMEPSAGSYPSSFLQSLEPPAEPSGRLKPLPPPPAAYLHQLGVGRDEHLAEGTSFVYSKTRQGAHNVAVIADWRGGGGGSQGGVRYPF